MYFAVVVVVVVVWTSSFFLPLGATSFDCGIHSLELHLFLCMFSVDTNYFQTFTV